MSINVTVNGNPVCIKRRVVLSDVEQIRRNECERRRKLRLEQVREQSKEISSKLLNRTKNIAKKIVNGLENDKDSELRRMHEKKILETQKKYQEDMEAIGTAHMSAAAQPDVQFVLENEKRKHQTIAAERGKEAALKLRESALQEDPVAQQQERLRQVREVENVRSAMIANLAKKSPKKVSAPQPSPVSMMMPSTSVSEEPRKPSPSKKKQKRIGKTSPVTVISKPDVQVVGSHPIKRVVVEIHEEDCPSDILEPRKKAPTASRLDRPEKINTIPEYDPIDYQQGTSESTSSISVSDDSSYFSDGIHERLSANKPALRQDTKVQLYDHNTRQWKTYDHAQGVVERIGVVNEPNAIESADKISRVNQTRDSIEGHRAIAQQRGAKAIRRERVKKDYADLMQELDHLSREERKLKATQTCNKPITDKKRRQQKRDMKQAEMNRAFEASHVEPLERIITIDKNADKEYPGWDSPYDSVYERSDNSPDESGEVAISRNEQILEMLKKVERQKRSLLEEFGASLPEAIFNASMNRLFDSQRPTRPETQPQEAQTLSPEIKIIKMMETTKQPKRIETAVQTSKMASPEATIVNDKSIQVELIETSKDKTMERTSEKIADRTAAEGTSEPLEYVEPIVKILHPEVMNNSSDSSGAGIVIDFSKQQVKVTATKRKALRPKKTAKSLPSSGRTSPMKKHIEIPSSASASAPTSRMSSPQEVVEEDRPKKFKLPERARPPCDTSTDISFEQPPSHRTRVQSNGKPYVKIKQSILKKYYNNTSDTSTSYASLPAVHPGSSYLEPSNMTPILQMLDSSANDSVVKKFKERDISPVSTPETPSPRTMRIPSNIPDPQRLGRILRFDETQQKSVDSRNKSARSKKTSRESYEDSQVCKCKNPTCRLIHQDMAELPQNYVSNHNSEAIKKYDELQNICTERIASLTALIKQVRDEKQEDYSLTAPSDDTSLMQMPPSKPRDDLHSVQKLVESIEAIHSQLAKTLRESQKIITGNLHVSRDIESTKPEILSLRSEKCEKSPQIIEQHQPTELEVQKKPTIINEETVKINLQRYKQILQPQHASTQLESSYQDVMVEKISQEILEQTKITEKGSRTVKEPESPTRKEKSASPRKDRSESPPSADEINKAFIPLLAGIPKVPKVLPVIIGNGKRRPPPVTHPGIHQGIENLSPPHELSTIAEFDTPDTANKSHISVRSPLGKSKRALPLCTPVQNKIPEEEEHQMKPVHQSPVQDVEIYAKDKSNKSSDFNGIKEVTRSNNKLITSSSSNSFSALSGISEILSTPTSDAAMWASSPPEHMEDQLRSLGLGWAVPILRKTRQAGALSSSSSSDVTILATIRKKKSPVKKNGSIPLMGLDFSDVSSISIHEASKSTERAVLMKARTSTPNIQNSNCSSPKSTTHSSTSAISRDDSDSVNLSLKKR